MVSRDKESWPGMTHFGFNGMERDDDIAGRGNSYTTEFRLYDSRLGRWKSIDPKATPWESPFVGMGNNPIRYIDPKGDTIRGTNQEMAEYKKFRNDLNTDIFNLNQKINSYGNSPVPQNIKDELNEKLQTNSELDGLENSTQDYVLDLNPTKKGKFDTRIGNIVKSGVTYNDAVIIRLDQASVNQNKFKGLFAHELKHAWQFETNVTTFNIIPNSNMPGSHLSLWDLADEIEAYKRQFYFALGTLNDNSGNPIRNVNQINSNFVLTRPDANGNYAYSFLRGTSTVQISLNINLAKQFNMSILLQNPWATSNFDKKNLLRNNGFPYKNYLKDLGL